VKHADYQPGDNVASAKFEGSWTAILINGSWYLADVHWCSKSVTGVDPGDWELVDDNGKAARDVSKPKTKVIYQYDEFYFLTNPEQFIYSHFPKETKWQLLARPVSLEEFTQMAKLEARFFEYKLCLKSHYRCIETAPEGAIEIELDIPPDSVYKFMYRLWISKRNKNESTYKDKKLKQYVFMEVYDGILSCKIEFPVSGKFKLELFCNDSAVSDSYFLVCTYVINVAKAKKNARAYPENSRPQWGPSHDLEAVGLKPISNKRGMVRLEKGEMEMSFSAEKDVRILPKLHSNNKTADSMKGFVVYWFVDKKFTMNMKFPEAGDYALNLYAKKKENDESDGLPNVCSYLISTEKHAVDTSPFFISGSGQLGANDDFDLLRMKAVSQPSAYVVAPDNGQMDFSFKTPIPCELLAKLILCRDSEEQFMDGFTLIAKKINRATVTARFPEKGSYKLEMYGKEKSKDGAFQVVFVYLIDVNQPMSDCYQFPKTYSCWTDGCELSQPDIGSPLFIYKTIPFAVKVPEAHDVAVVHPTTGWTRLKKDRKQMWRGDVSTGSEAGKVIQLCARFAKEPDSYSTLLEFEVRQRTSFIRLYRLAQKDGLFHKVV